MTTISQPSVRPRPARNWASLLLNQEVILAVSLIALVIVVGAINPRFVAERNMSDILQGNAYIAIAAIGMSMVIITGNIDISVGALMGVLATLCGTLAVIEGFPIWLAWFIPLIFGGLAGAINGFFVAYLGLPSIVVTLGMFSILKGGLILANGGVTIYNLPEGFGLAQMRPLGIPAPIIFMVVLTLIAAFWMRYTAAGRSLYAVGGNKEAARNSGIDTKRVIMMAFIINGVMTGFASVLSATQFTSIQAVVTQGQELLIITSAVVGGVSILGGTGSVIGAMLASILLRAIGSALVFVNVSNYWTQAVQGLLILVTVLVDVLRRHQLNRR